MAKPWSWIVVRVKANKLTGMKEQTVKFSLNIKSFRSFISFYCWRKGRPEEVKWFRTSWCHLVV